MKKRNTEVKRWLAAALSLIMVVSLSISVLAENEENIPGGNTEFVESQNEPENSDSLPVPVQQPEDKGKEGEPVLPADNQKPEELETDLNPVEDTGSSGTGKEEAEGENTAVSTPSDVEPVKDPEKPEDNENECTGDETCQAEEHSEGCPKAAAKGAAWEKVQELIDALPEAETLAAWMENPEAYAGELTALQETIDAIGEAVEALTAEEYALLDLTKLTALMEGIEVLAEEPQDNSVEGEMSGAELLAKAVDGVITLTGDVTLTETAVVNGTLKVDLDGFTLTGTTGKITFASGDDAVLTVSDGEINSGVQTESTHTVFNWTSGSLTLNAVDLTAAQKAVRLENDAVGIIDGQTVITAKGNPAIHILCESNYGDKKPTLEVYGTVKALNWWAISGDGSKDLQAGSVINIYPGARVEAEESLAVFHPQLNGELNVFGGTIVGLTGIEMRAGTLNVTGTPEIKGNYDGRYQEPVLNTQAPGSGNTVFGVGIAVSQHVTKEKTEINISGGTISGVQALYDTNLVKNDKAARDKVKLNIKGGVFETTGKKEAIYSIDHTMFLSGGTFSTKFEEAYCIEGYELVEKEGVFVLQEKADEDFCAEAGGIKYKTLQAAIDAGAGEVKLLRDTTESVTIPAGTAITLDLNGCVLTGMTGSDGKMKDVLTNKGTLVIMDTQGGGVVMGGTGLKADDKNDPGRSGQALVNTGTCTLKSGTLKRGDNETFGNYTVCNTGEMNIEGGAVTNNSHKSSMIFNGGTVVISGGTITQNLMTAVKNEWNAKSLTVTGGTITSTQPVQNWSKAAISGGTFNGEISAYTMPLTENLNGGQPVDCQMNITGGVINGDVCAYNYSQDGVNAEGSAVINISGAAQVTGSLQTLSRIYNDKMDASEERSKVENGTLAAIWVSGGTFNKEITAEYCAEGYEPADNGDGTYSVKVAENQTKFVAKIGEKGYEILQDALNEASKTGGEVVLLQNINLGNSFAIIRGKTTLNLNGYSIEGAGEYVLAVLGQGVTIKNGHITSSSAKTLAAVYAQNASMTLDSVEIDNAGTGGEKTHAGLMLGNGTGSGYYGSAVISNSRISGSGSNGTGITVIGKEPNGEYRSVLQVSDSEISGTVYGISGNGSYDGTSIILNSGTKVKTTQTTVGAGIYHPQQGALIVNSGVEVEGPVGIQICGGDAVINSGSTIRSTDPARREGPFKDNKYGDGSVLDGAAVSVVSRKGYGDINVTINGGNFTCANRDNDAVKLYGFEKKDGQWQLMDTLPTNAVVTISGGTFTKAPLQEYCAEGYQPIANGDGTYTVRIPAAPAPAPTTPAPAPASSSGGSSGSSGSGRSGGSSGTPAPEAAPAPTAAAPVAGTQAPAAVTEEAEETEETVEIAENETPLASGEQEELKEIEDDEIPLFSPQLIAARGGSVLNILLILLLAGALCGGAGWYIIVMKRRKAEEE